MKDFELKDILENFKPGNISGNPLLDIAILDMKMNRLFIDNILSSDIPTVDKIKMLVEKKNDLLFEITNYNASTVDEIPNKKEKNAFLLEHQEDQKSLLSEIEIAILNISTGKKEVSKSQPRSETTKYNNGTLILLFKLLEQQQIIVTDNSKKAFFLQNLTGIPLEQLRQSFSKQLSGSSSRKKFTQNDFKQVLSDLEEMVIELKKHIKKD